jgi:hypothetical protein
MPAGRHPVPAGEHFMPAGRHSVPAGERFVPAGRQKKHIIYLLLKNY